MKFRLASLTFLALNLSAAHLVYQKNIPATLVAGDSSGNAYIYGSSGLSKLDASGNVVYSNPLLLPVTAAAMAVDSAGNVFIAGNTNSDALPTTAGVFQPKRSPGVCITGDKAAQPYPCPDAFILKIGPTGNLAWASYLGGLNSDQANAVAVDPEGNVYVTGLTLSADFPVLSAFQSQFGGYADAFITKISADGSKILYSGFLGGAGYDVGHGIAVDAAGNAYVAGIFGGSDYPAAFSGFGTGCGAGDSNAFLVKVNPNGDSLTFGGCLGVPGHYTEATAVALDGQGAIYVAGDTNSGSFPTTPGAFAATSLTPTLVFVSKIAADGSALTYSALFPGAPFGVYSIAVDASGAAYLSGAASAALPVAGPAMQPCIGADYLLKLNAAGSALLYSSFGDAARMALAPDGSVLLAGVASVRRLATLESPGESYLAAECVLNAGSLISHQDYGQPGISPGEIVALKGTGLGPITPPAPIVANGVLANIVGGTQVFFDGVAVPLMYVQDAQINVVAPYGLAGKTTTSIQVRYQGQTTQPVSVAVSATSAALFQQPDGTSIVLNQDYSQNSLANPVPRGEVLVLYMTGAGQTSPLSVDGQIWQKAGGLAALVSAQLTSYGSYGAVTAAIPVAYAGPAPTLVSGVEQFNIEIPADLSISFVTPAIGIPSVVSLQIGAQQLSFAVYVR